VITMPHEGDLSGDEFQELALSDAILATDRYEELLARVAQLEKDLELAREVAASRGDWIINRLRKEKDAH